MCEQRRSAVALRPDEIFKQVDREDGEALAKLERSIDSQLRGQFDGSNSVQVDLNHLKLRPAVKQALLKRYRDAGWSASINEGSCQRDGTWCYLVLSADRKRK